MKNRQQPIGGERAEEQTLAAAAIIDELASHGAVRGPGAVAELTNRELRPVLAVAVGQDAVGRLRPVEIDDRGLNRMHGADRRDGDGSSRPVLHFDFDLPPRTIAKQPQGAHEVGCA